MPRNGMRTDQRIDVRFSLSHSTRDARPCKEKSSEKSRKYWGNGRNLIFHFVWGIMRRFATAYLKARRDYLF